MVALAIRWDQTNVRRSMLALRRDMPKATEDVVRIMVAAVSRRAMRDAVRMSYDTGRFARGFARIHNSVAGPTGGGTGTIPVLALPQLRIGKYAADIGVRIIVRRYRWEAAWRRTEARAAQLRSARNLSARGRRYLRQLESELDRLDRALAELRKQDAVLRATWKQPGVIIMLGRKTSSAYRISNIERVYPAEYPSAAVLRNTGGRVDAVMEHREPHALVANRRTGILTLAIRDLHHETSGLMRDASRAAAGRLRERERQDRLGMHITAGRV